jgi:stage II sporulation protein D
LNSANFTIEQTAESVTFHTVGFGHGVGMSQTGANAMAKQGANYIDILTHYFTGVTVG